MTTKIKSTLLNVSQATSVTTAVLLVSWALAPRAATAGQRAITDFTSQQMAWCLIVTDQGVDCTASGYGPACDNGFSLETGDDWADPKSGVQFKIDRLGIFNQQVFGGALGTTVDGSVSETRLSDGRAEVQVILRTHNALIRAYQFNPSTGDVEPLFGYLLGEVLSGAPATLGDSVFQMSFKNTKPGAPLPDLAQLLICPEPGQELEVLSIRAQASGPLRAAFGVPEGTPGRLEMAQTGLIATALKANLHSRVALDAFPAEHIIIRATGH